MTSPLIIVKPKESVTNTAKIMNRQNVRRIVVVNKGDLVGIITSKDILRIMPELIEIFQEENKIETLNFWMNIKNILKGLDTVMTVANGLTHLKKLMLNTFAKNVEINVLHNKLKSNIIGMLKMED